MSDQYNDDFFGGGGEGAASAKFTTRDGIGNQTEVGGYVVGTVVSTRQMDQTKIGTNEKLLDDHGRVKQQLQVILQTDWRDWNRCAKVPTNSEGHPIPGSEDDGKRAIYVKGWMVGAIGDAIRESGAPGLRPGGKLAVKITELVPTTNGNPYAKYLAKYQPPAPGDSMFEMAQQQQQPPAFAQAAPVQQAPAPAPAPAPVQQAPVPAPQPAPVQAAPVQQDPFAQAPAPAQPMPAPAYPQPQQDPFGDPPF